MHSVYAIVYHKKVHSSLPHNKWFASPTGGFPGVGVFKAGTITEDFTDSYTVWCELCSDGMFYQVRVELAANPKDVIKHTNWKDNKQYSIRPGKSRLVAIHFRGLHLLQLETQHSVFWYWEPLHEANPLWGPWAGTPNPGPTTALLEHIEDVWFPPKEEELKARRAIATSSQASSSTARVAEQPAPRAADRPMAERQQTAPAQLQPPTQPPTHPPQPQRPRTPPLQLRKVLPPLARIEDDDDADYASGKPLKSELWLGSDLPYELSPSIGATAGFKPVSRPKDVGTGTSSPYDPINAKEWMAACAAYGELKRFDERSLMILSSRIAMTSIEIQKERADEGDKILPIDIQRYQGRERFLQLLTGLITRILEGNPLDYDRTDFVEGNGPSGESAMLARAAAAVRAPGQGEDNQWEAITYDSSTGKPLPPGSSKAPCGDIRAKLTPGPGASSAAAASGNPARLTPRKERPPVPAFAPPPPNLLDRRGHRTADEEYAEQKAREEIDRAAYATMEQNARDRERAAGDSNEPPEAKRPRPPNPWAIHIPGKWQGENAQLDVKALEAFDPFWRPDVIPLVAHPRDLHERPRGDMLYDNVLYGMPSEMRIMNPRDFREMPRKMEVCDMRSRWWNRLSRDVCNLLRHPGRSGKCAQDRGGWMDIHDICRLHPLPEHL